jgi:hypothetical protein
MTQRIEFETDSVYDDSDRKSIAAAFVDFIEEIDEQVDTKSISVSIVYDYEKNKSLGENDVAAKFIESMSLPDALDFVMKVHGLR